MHLEDRIKCLRVQGLRTLILTLRTRPWLWRPDPNPDNQTLTLRTRPWSWPWSWSWQSGVDTNSETSFSGCNRSWTDQNLFLTEVYLVSVINIIYWLMHWLIDVLIMCGSCQHGSQAVVSGVSPLRPVVSSSGLLCWTHRSFMDQPEAWRWRQSLL